MAEVVKLKKPAERDFLHLWEEHVADAPSPPLFKRWVGISIVAAAMERKCWVRTMGKELYPNLYTILVSPPGVGKTFLTAIAQELIESLGTHHAASSSVSKASLMDELRDSERHIIRHDAPVYSFNSLYVISNELGVLIPAYEGEFMSALTDIYDGKGYSERKRGKEIQFRIKAPQLNLLAGVTPSYLKDLLPEGAWDQGFLSRCILVYNGETEPGDLFKEDLFEGGIPEPLSAELKRISEAFGSFGWTEESKELMQNWHNNRGEPRPDHPKLAHYNTRRTAHLLKLCQVASIIESDDLIITVEHWQRALDWLTEAEGYMRDIFKAMSSGGDIQLIRECWHFAYSIYVKERKPIAEYRILRFLQEHTPAHNVERVLDMMVRQRLLRREHINKEGNAIVPMGMKDV